MILRRRNPDEHMARFYSVQLQGVLRLEDDPQPDRFVCPRCGAVSYNPNDIAQRYCARCRVFVDDPWIDLVREWGRIGSPGTLRLDRFAGEAEARAAAERMLARKRRRGYR